MAKTSGVTLDELIKNMNKKQGEIIVQQGLSDYDYKRIPFTSPNMNYCTYGGIPIGRLVEFFGEEHGGKTSTALDVVANYQQLPDAKKVLYVDAENTLDVEWARKFGVEVEDMIILQPKSQSAEEIFQFIVEAVETGEVGLWVLDSIGALFSAQEYEKSLEDKTYAGISKPLTLFSKRIVQAMHGNECTGIGINQIRDNLNSSWGGVTTPGGRGWKHACAVRIQFSQGRFYDENDKEISRNSGIPVGNLVQVHMEKNKTCPPKRHNAIYSINYDLGVDYLKDVVEVAITLGYINKHGGWYDFVDVDSGEVLGEKIQGQNAVKKYLSEHTDILELIEKGIDKLVTEM